MDEVCDDSVVEQSHAGEGHGHAVLVALGDDQIVTDGAAGLCNVADAALLGALDVIGEGEESVAAQSYAGLAVQIGPDFLCGQMFGLLGEVVLPVAVSADILLIAIDEAIDDIVADGTGNIGTEGQIQNGGMLTQPPGIGLAACQTGAVDTPMA